METGTATAATEAACPRGGIPRVTRRQCAERPVLIVDTPSGGRFPADAGYGAAALVSTAVLIAAALVSTAVLIAALVASSLFVATANRSGLHGAHPTGDGIRLRRLP